MAVERPLLEMGNDGITFNDLAEMVLYSCKTMMRRKEWQSNASAIFARSRVCYGR